MDFTALNTAAMLVIAAVGVWRLAIEIKEKREERASSEDSE